MPFQEQNISAEGMFALLGVSGYRGVTAVQNGTTPNSLDITLAARTYAVLADGTVLSRAQLLPAAGVAAITGVANGAQSVWLDVSQDTLLTPKFSASVAAPSASAIAVATFTAAAGAIGAVTPATAGLVF